MPPRKPLTGGWVATKRRRGPDSLALPQACPEPSRRAQGERIGDGESRGVSPLAGVWGCPPEALQGGRVGHKRKG